MFTMIALSVFLFRLILGEEAFLSVQLGEPYAAYKRAVPRLIPGIRPGIVAGGRSANWVGALLGEVMPLGLLVSYAALSWQYNAGLLTRAVLVSFGLSLVVRALILPRPNSAQPAA